MLRTVLASTLALAALVLPAASQEAADPAPRDRGAVERLEPAERAPGARPSRADAQRRGRTRGPAQEARPEGPGRDLEALRRRFEQLDPEQRRAFLRGLRESRARSGEGGAGRPDDSIRGERRDRAPQAGREGLRERLERLERLDPQQREALRRRLQQRAQDQRGDRRGVPGGQRGSLGRPGAGDPRGLRERLQGMSPAERRAAFERLRASGAWRGLDTRGGPTRSRVRGPQQRPGRDAARGGAPTRERQQVRRQRSPRRR
jgi:hypothetical protein